LTGKKKGKDNNKPAILRKKKDWVNHKTDLRGSVNPIGTPPHSGKNWNQGKK